MKLRMLAFVGTVIALTSVGLLQVAGAQEGGGDTSTIICHATGSETNPFVVIVTDSQAEIEGHVPQHPEDFILTTLPKPPDQVTGPERDEFLEQCAAAVTTTTTIAPTTTTTIAPTTTTTGPDGGPGGRDVPDVVVVPGAAPAQPVTGQAPFVG